MNRSTFDDNRSISLYDKLKENMHNEIYPFHMPGHKRNIDLLHMENPYGIDITEIDNFDNLHAPEGIILGVMNRISQYYQTDSSYVLINGSTSGILSAISAVTSLNDEVIMARNCHKSVYNAVFLRNIKAHYLMPSIDEYGICGQIEPANIEECMKKNPLVKVVIITSPTYEGIVSNVREIANIVHSNNGILIVDEAHGAHFGKHEYFPRLSYDEGADIVIQSIHKTLPAMTQTAIMHVNKERVSLDKIKKYLSIYQTSSPSYVLMASVDKCFSLLKKDGKELFITYVSLLKDVSNRLKELKHIRLYTPDFSNASYYDRGKIVITIEDDRISGKDLQDILLNEYRLQMEMCQSKYIIAMTSFCDTKEGIDRFVKALIDIDNNWDILWKDKIPHNEGYALKDIFQLPESVMTAYEAVNMDTENISITDSIERIVGDYVYLYPPGVPIIVPGEKINKQVINIINSYIERNLNVIGLSEDKKNIKVVTEK